MKTKFLFIAFTISVVTKMNAQPCDRLFTASITYSNQELGLSYNNFQTGVYYRVFQRTNESTNNNCTTHDIKKPIIIVEGYDIFHEENTSVIYSDYINPPGIQLGDQLRSEGYDIITLNWETPSVALQLNALILEQFISHINEVKSSNEDLIIMGVSMGGLLTRYALTDMESKGMNHDTKLFISFDAPQQGAHVPLSIQAFLFNNLHFGLAVGDIADLYNNFVSDGTQQMLQNNFFQTTGGVTAPDPRYHSFFTELQSLNNCNGYPKNSKNVAISNGTLKGKSDNCSLQECPSGTAIVVAFGPWGRVLNAAPGNWDFEETGTRCFYYNETPYDLNADWYLDVGSLPYDHLPGGTYPWYEIIRNEILSAGGSVPVYFYEKASFVSTISALDINTDHAILDLSSYGKQTILNNSPFDDIWWDTSHEDLEHASLTTEISEWIANQIDAVSNEDDVKSQFYNSTYSNIAVNNINQTYKSVNSLTLNGSTVISNGGRLKLVSGNLITINGTLDIPTGTEFYMNTGNISSPDCTLSQTLPSWTGY